MLSNYLLRYSKRAKYLQLRISYRGLEVVVPAKIPFSRASIEQFIQQKERWITRNWQRLQQNIGTEDEAIDILPTSIYLKAMDENWDIKYFQTNKAKVSLHLNPCKQITLMGNIANKTLCIEKVKQWLMKIAADYFEKELLKLCQETGLYFTQLTIRDNTTRWGSCSDKRNISLCCKLLFLPPSLMRHVMLHELCHTKVMHHGKAFWKLLEKFDHAAREHAKQLKMATSHIPRWMR